MVEGGEGLAPAGGDGAFDEAGGGGALVGGLAMVGLAGAVFYWIAVLRGVRNTRIMGPARSFSVRWVCYDRGVHRVGFILKPDKSEAGVLLECGPTQDLLAHPKSPAVRELMDMPQRQAERVRALTAASGPS